MSRFSRWKAMQSPTTWGTLSEDEFMWAQQFRQELGWDNYQQERKHYKPGMGEALMSYTAPRQDWLADEAKHRRDRVAESLLASLLTGYGTMPIDEEVMIDRALCLANALIEELDK